MFRISGTVFTILIGGLLLCGHGTARLVPAAHAQQMPETFDEMTTITEAQAQVVQQFDRMDELITKLDEVDIAYSNYLERTLSEGEFLSQVMTARRDSRATLDEIETVITGVLKREFGSSPIGDRMRAYRYEIPLIIDELREMAEASLTEYSEAIGPNPLSDKELSALNIERREVLSKMFSLSIGADLDLIPSSHPNHPFLSALIESEKQYVILQKIVHEWQYGERVALDQQIIAFHKSAESIRELERKGRQKLEQMLGEWEISDADAEGSAGADFMQDLTSVLATLDVSWDIEMRILANYERQAELYAGYDEEISYDILTPLYDEELALVDERWRVFADRIVRLNEAFQQAAPLME